MIKSKNSYFEIERAGINTTFQDLGRQNLNHIGIPVSGAMDKRNYILSNALLKKNLNSPVIEFAYQGPLLKYKGEETKLEIGDNNKIREYVTINPGTDGGGGLTKVGSNCLFMVSAHIAHDCYVVSNITIMSNMR